MGEPQVRGPSTGHLRVARGSTPYARAHLRARGRTWDHHERRTCQGVHSYAHLRVAFAVMAELIQQFLAREPRLAKAAKRVFVSGPDRIDLHIITR